ncbi:carboxylesterase family protein [Corynebacterium lubricantis]|uniref:carboxylesterase family protein n=1 Tax=Corynebacterium lubricantis TaxID=541095 RepID=UPI0003781F22|nr:carboxylesterase family protein [Corynebacterium lubricantis]
MHSAEVTCPAGTIVGVSDGVVDAYYSIPYAELRTPFSNATATHRGMMIDATGPRTDPMALTVMAPAGASDADDFPVLVYIHGGRFEEGSHNDERANGYATATQSVVHVQIDYRVGLAGFAPFHDDEPNHYRGIDDCNLALEWIQRNIEAFGGDPTNVTVVGQSAGAAITLWLARRDHFRGAFRRIVALSPAFPHKSYEQRRDTLQAAFLGMRLTRENFITASPRRIDAAYKRFRRRYVLDVALGPAPLEPAEMADVDVIVTSVRDEMIAHPVALKIDKMGLGTTAVKTLGPAIGIEREEIEPWLETARKMDPKHVFGRLLSDAMIRHWTDLVAEEAPAKVWQAEFLPSAFESAGHCHDLKPLFGVHPYTAGEGLHAQLLEYARTGHVGWPEYSADTGRTVMSINLACENAHEVRDPLGYVRSSFN